MSHVLKVLAALVLGAGVYLVCFVFGPIVPIVVVAGSLLVIAAK